MSVFNNLPLEDGRRSFLRWIENSRPQGSVNNQVTVVFDGHPDHAHPFSCYHSADIPKSHLGEIRVIFSDGCSADDKIKRMVEDDGDQKNCVVVSDDKDVYLYARSLGARVMSVAAFTSIKVQGKHDGSKPSSKYISLSRQEKINKEFAKIWLKEKE